MHQNLYCFSSRRLHTRWPRDWSSDVCSSDLKKPKKSKAPKIIAWSIPLLIIALVAYTFISNPSAGWRQPMSWVLWNEIGRTSRRERVWVGVFGGQRRREKEANMVAKPKR